METTKKRKLNQLHDSTLLCQNIRENLASLIALKRAGAANNEWKAKITDASLSILELKQSNREAQIYTESKKSEVSRSKQKLNQLNLQYYNILYEKNHFLKEIKQCRDFRYLKVFYT